MSKTENRSKWLSLFGLWSVSLLLGVSPATAQVPTGPVALSNTPLFSTVTVQPNVMFTLDNSGSMNWSYAPMTVLNNRWRHCSTSASYNRLYYDPNINYVPPVNADGTSFPNANYTNAWIDGFRQADGTINLQTAYPNIGRFVLDTLRDNDGAFMPYTAWNGQTYPPNASVGGYYMVYNGTNPDPAVCYPDTSYTVVQVNTLTAQQKQNFANWFSYYRNRMLAMKSAVGHAFRTVDQSFRVGFMTIDGLGNQNEWGGFLPVSTFSGANRQAWYNLFYSMRAWYATPLRDAMQKVGEYYKNVGNPVPGQASPADPIQYSCQQNYHILSTDGQWNGNGANGAAANNNDSTLPNDPQLLTALGREFSTTFNAGDPWPRPYRENPGQQSSNTLADIAAYYWREDMRPSMTNNVPTSAANPANWQHVVTFGVALSEQGSIPYPSGITGLQNGSTNWPTPVADQPSAVDDLWHSALVGHGQYFNVVTPAQLTDALGRALNDIRSRAGSASGANFSSNDLSSASGLVAFRASFMAGEWTGNLTAHDVSQSDGVVSSVPKWSASALLDERVKPAGAGGGWLINRRITTWRTDSNIATPFLWNNLSTTQKATIDADAARGERILNYLRGDRSFEDGPGTPREFRQRSSVLGDLVNSEPRYVAKPSASLSESFNSGYEAFKTARASRRPMLYVGGNDGMLHAFDATVNTASSGQELWAHVPSMVYQTGVDGLAGLAYRLSDPPPNRFEHRYRVDATPTVEDVDFGRTVGGTGTNWRTLLVGGMRQGGRGYYAIDVTDPEAANESQVAAKVLWEFRGEVANDPRMGLTMGEPIIFKTRRFGWVVAVSSGYNNVAGTGHVWLLNPRTGAVLHRFDSGIGSTGVPSGLAHVNVFMQSSRDGTAEQIYATDLMGYVHRFDVSSMNAGDWTLSGVKVASVGKPLTSAPTIAVNPFNNNERWVFFGSGMLLSLADRTSNRVHTKYAVKDGSAQVPNAFAAPLVPADLDVLSPTGTVPQGPLVKGWRMDMPSGHHIVVAPLVARTAVVWSTTDPTTDLECSPGAGSTTYARGFGDFRSKFGTVGSITQSANVVKNQMVKVTASSTSNSKGKYKINQSLGDSSAGAPPQDIDLDFTLIGGRTGMRYVNTF